MNGREALTAATILAIGAILNYAYPVGAEALSIPIGIEFVIVAYCLVVMLIPLRLPEALGIGVIAGALNIVSNPAHTAAILGGQVTESAGVMALVNLVSEPIGILVCVWVFAWLCGKARTAAPAGAAFAATMASGLVYLLVVLLISPAPISTDPAGYLASFLIRVITAAITSGIVVQILFMAGSGLAKAYIGGQQSG